MYHLVRLCSKRNTMQRYVSKERETRLYCKICNKKNNKKKISNNYKQKKCAGMAHSQRLNRNRHQFLGQMMQPLSNLLSLLWSWFRPTGSIMRQLLLVNACNRL